ncbi:hypothetical protein [Carboxylicivirga caseinilyticus]|uniref:hypothetical protein n=1 Tax=Carboxylicivirga caseinilyticus TaxID=3417572 RepID=UPI003D33D5EB|nr:hypothetical protein [Marinilabiliaceae bacterium A049]
MKLLLSLFLFLITLTIKAQDLKYFNRSIEFNWETHGFNAIDMDQLKQLSFFKEHYDFIYEEHWAKNIGMFHSKDIDQDGWTDIIYNGWNGGEGEMLVILMNDQGQYRITQSFIGHVVEWMDTLNGSVIKLFDYGCCGAWVDHLVTIKYCKEKEQFNIVDDIANMVVIDSTLKYMNPIRFEIQNETYNLRYAPDIEIGIPEGDTPFDVIDGQNISAVYYKGDQGTALASKEDSTGRVWWLVIMDKAPTGETILYPGSDEYDNYRPIGWFSSRYLKKTNKE